MRVANYKREKGLGAVEPSSMPIVVHAIDKKPRYQNVFIFLLLCDVSFAEHLPSTIDKGQPSPLNKIYQSTYHESTYTSTKVTDKWSGEE